MRILKKWQSFIAVILCVVLAFSTLATYLPDSTVSEVYAAEAQADENGFIIEDGILTKYTGTATDIMVPDGVIGVGSSAFLDCNSLISIKLPDGLESIGYSAFRGCSSLTSINMPDGVKSIASQAFSGCSSLISIEIPESVTYMDSMVFENCSSLKSVKWPESRRAIPPSTFKGCTSLTSISIPNGVTSIGNRVFAGCCQLEDVVIPESVTEIGSDAFGGTKWLSKKRLENPFVVVNHILIDGTMVAGEVAIPEGVEKIGSYAFSGCSGLTGIVISEGVAEIEYNAFAYCSNLANVKLPKSLEKMNYSVFYGCSSLTYIELAEGSTKVLENMCHDCSSLTKVTLPESVTSIGNNAFMGCRSLVDITVPEGVTSIGSWAFANCRSLTDIVLPEGLTDIDWGAFAVCSGLKDIKLPDSVTKIGAEAFSGIPFHTFTIGPNVSEMNYRTFAGCEDLEEVLVDERNESFVSVNGTILSKDRSQLIWKSKGESCIKSFTLQPAHITIGERAYGRETWNENPNYYKYSVPEGFVRGTITFSDGVTREGTLRELYEGYRDVNGGYEYKETSDQSGENVWEPGEHSFFLSILGSEAMELKVTIRPEDQRTESISKGEAEHKLSWKLLENVGSIGRTYQLGEFGILSFYWKDTQDGWESSKMGILILNEEGEEVAKYKLDDLWEQFKRGVESGETLYLENASFEGENYYLLLKKEKQNEKWEWEDVDSLKLSTKDGISFQEEKEELVEKEIVVIEGEECTVWKWGAYAIAVSNSTEKNISYYVSENGGGWEKRVLPFENRYRSGVLKTTEKAVYFYNRNEYTNEISEGNIFQSFQCCYFTSDLKNFTKVIESKEEEQWRYTLGANTENGFLLLAQQYSSEGDVALRTCIYRYDDETNTIKTLWDTYDLVSGWAWQNPTAYLNSYSAYDFCWMKGGKAIKTWISTTKGLLDEYVLNVSEWYGGDGVYDDNVVYDDETGIIRYKYLNITFYSHVPGDGEYIWDSGKLLLSGDYYKTMWELNMPEHTIDWPSASFNYLSGCCFYTVSSISGEGQTYMINLYEERDSLYAMLDTIFAIEKDGVTLQCTGTAMLDEQTTIAVEWENLAEEELKADQMDGKKTAVCNVGLYFNEESVDLGNGFQMFMEVPEGFDGSKCSVYFVQPDGSLKDMGAKLDEDGELTFLTTEAGRFIVAEEEKALLGDVNGDGEIDSKDALAILKDSVGIEQLVFIKEAADVNKDTQIDSKDALMVLKHSVGILEIE